MKRNLVALAASVAVAGALVLAQAPAGQQAPSQSQAAPSADDKAKDTTLTGCLIQGSGPMVFVLENAKTNPADRDAKGVSYIVAAASPTVDLKSQLNHEVRIVGPAPADAKEAPMVGAGGKIAEKDMAKFTARTITSIADTCSTVG